MLTLKLRDQAIIEAGDDRRGEAIPLSKLQKRVIKGYENTVQIDNKLASLVCPLLIVASVQRNKQVAVFAKEKARK